MKEANEGLEDCIIKKFQVMQDGRLKVSVNLDVGQWTYQTNHAQFLSFSKERLFGDLRKVP